MIQMLAAWVANIQSIPAPVAAVIGAAFVIEACLYVLPMIEGVRGASSGGCPGPSWRS